ncbi:putative pectinesterase 11 [Phragmites australis]|uniref:putative pectinesterase 11 n=1 Tax=Phragmites australis TaxID=29695 RepID=UPI002D7A060D|nr:putative pectinesterase 11 [Phragmites australis]
MGGYDMMLLNRVNSPARAAAAAALLALCLCFASVPCFSSESDDGAAGMPASRQLVITVDQSGKGDHRTIQDAIDAAPANDSAGSVVIRIKPGVYRQKVVVNKPGITLTGTSATSTVISWNESWVSADSPTVSVLAPDFIAKRLTFQNTFGASAPAVAVRVAGDRATFYGCRFVSFQDTLLDETGRHYYRGCYVEGGTDFIFGNGQALFDKCHLHSTSSVGGAFTAHKRSSESENTGYSFVGCKLTGLGAGTSILGRPWGPYSRVVFALSYMSSTVRPQGWDDWGDPMKQRTAFYGQYQCYGEGSKTDGRVSWSHNLSQTEAAPFITKVWVDGQEWLR